MKLSGIEKWIAGGLGWVLLNPIGGLLGFTIGYLLEKMVAKDEHQVKKGQTTGGDFAMSLIVLVAAVMKADGQVLKSELNYAKQFFRANFGDEATARILIMLRDLLKHDIPVPDVCRQIEGYTEYATRLQLLHMLYGIAQADGHFHTNEAELIDVIAQHLGIGKPDHESIKAMFFDDLESAYKVLEIPQTATNEAVKKAYRKMALLYHPDKVAKLGEDFEADAKQKFLKVSEAYERIKKERGMA